MRALAQVMQQQCETQSCRIVFFSKKFAKAKRVCWLVRSEPIDCFNRYERMLIDRVPMVKVWDDEAIDTVPLGYSRSEEACLLHFAEGKRGVWLGKQLAPENR